jgi:hypothetical protein
MSLGHGASIVRSRLVLQLDAANTKSYPGSGTAWTDISSVTASTTLYNTPTFSSGAFTFNGTNQYAVAPINLNYTQGTISLWVYPTAANNNNFCVYTANAPLSSYTHQLGISTTNKLLVYMFDGSAKLSTGTTTLSLNTWYNLSLVWLNGSYYRGYINGVQETTAALGTAWTSGSNFYIASSTGGANSAPANYFVGRMSTVQIYNVALSDAQLQQNFQALRGRYGV